MKNSLIFVLFGIFAGITGGTLEPTIKGKEYFHRSLPDKGLPAAEVMKKSKLKPIYSRPLPIVVLHDEFSHSQTGSVNYEKIPVDCLEDAGIKRTETISLGLPLPQGAVYATANIRLTDENNREIPIQTAVTGKWPDQSLKWVLMKFTADFEARQKRIFNVEFGNEIHRTAVRGIKISDDEIKVIIDAGRIKAVINKNQFNLLDSITLDKKNAGSFGRGMILVDKNGHELSTVDGKVTCVVIEENGANFATVRIDGNYKNSHLSYTARLRFKWNSPVIGIEFTHINTEIADEFTDITALYFDYHPEFDISNVLFDQENIKPGQRLFQMNDLQLLKPDGNMVSERLSGKGYISGNDKNVSIALRDCWQRWPKAFSVTDNYLRIELLPRLGGNTFTEGLPWYLKYPFNQDKHRSKWGMAFTERIDFNLSGRNDGLSIALNQPITAVLPVSYWEKTEVIPGVGGPNMVQFESFDLLIDKAWQGSLNRREKQREYGYFNYGDAWGERGTNWNNNEYDFGAALFAAFIRTGNRDYYRWAMKIANHQADVDICHAYPDPYYVGSNLQHSIGHSGLWMAPKKLDWSYLYDSHASADSGHVWSRGMGLAWWMSGDTGVRNALNLLGDHIAFSMAPNFKRLPMQKRNGGWSLKAMCDIYEVTRDPEHLEGAHKLAEVILKAQRFDQGGAWPDRIGRLIRYDEKEVVGNTVFQIGILLGGLIDYHRITGGEEVKQSLIAAGKWLISAFDPAFGCWYYDVSWDGKPLNSFVGRPARGIVTVNSLIGAPLMYIANLSNDMEMKSVSFQTLQAIMLFKFDAVAKNFAISTYNIDRWFGEINHWTKKHPDELFIYNENAVIEEMLKHKTPAFMLRLPMEKEFRAYLKNDQTVLKLEHLRYNGMAGTSLDKKIVLLAPDGVESSKGAIDSNKNYTAEYPVNGKPGDIFTFKITDDTAAAWSLLPSNEYEASAVFGKSGIAIGQSGVNRFYFRVPTGVKYFRIWQSGFMTGNTAMRIFAPNGNLAANINGDQEINTIQINKPQPGIWSLVSWGGGTQRFGFIGIPGEIFLTPPEEGDIMLKVL